MAAIIGPKFRVVEVQKTSTAEDDRKNDGYGRYEVVAEVRFNLYSDSGDTKAITEKAMDKLDHALS